MKFEDAEKRLIELAKGNYCHLQYERTHYSEASGGGIKQECRLYIANIGATAKSTWERAFRSIEAQIAGEPDPTHEFTDKGPEGETHAEETKNL